MARLVLRVVLTGPDGAGKSTALNAVRASPEAQSLRFTQLHFDPRSGQSAAAPVSQPHAQPPRSDAGSMAVVLTRAARYVHSRLRGPLSGRGADVVIQERGWHDQIVDPYRYRLRPSGAQAARVLRRVIAAMDLQVHLTGDPVIIHNRKPEMSLNELSRQLAAWDSIQTSADRQPIDTTARSLDRVGTDFLEAIRTARTMRLASALGPVVGAPSRLEMIASPRAGMAIRALYRPLSHEGRLVWRSGALRSWRRSNSGLSGIVAETLATLAIPADAVAAIRSVGRQRFVVATQVDGRLNQIVKLSCAIDSSLQSEAAFLSRVGAIEGLRIPRVTWHGKVDTWWVLVMPALDGASALPSVDKRIALDTSVALRWARSGEGVTHGDLTPWNVLSGDRPGLVDWEEASFGVRPGVDLARYLVTAGLRNRSRLRIGDREWRAMPIWREYSDATHFEVDEVIDGARTIVEGCSRVNL